MSDSGLSGSGLNGEAARNPVHFWHFFGKFLAIFVGLFQHRKRCQRRNSRMMNWHGRVVGFLVADGMRAAVRRMQKYLSTYTPKFCKFGVHSGMIGIKNWPIYTNGLQFFKLQILCPYSPNTFELFSVPQCGGLVK